MSNPRFNLLHALSDWFRSPYFRDRFAMEKLTDADRIEILRVEYQLNDEEIGIVTKSDLGPLAARIKAAVLDSNPEAPDDWPGVAHPVFRGNQSAFPPHDAQGPGWPGRQFVCIESVKPKVVRSGQPVPLEVSGWNLDSIVTVRLARPNNTFVDLVPHRPIVTDGNGRSTFTATVTLLESDVGPWDIQVLSHGKLIQEGVLVNGLVSV